MPTLNILSGIPGSGKTRSLFDVPHSQIVSTDNIRIMLGGIIEYLEFPNEMGSRRLGRIKLWTGNQSKVFKIAHNRISFLLSSGLDCWFDATNIDDKSRLAAFQIADFLDCEKVLHIWHTPLDVCLERNNSRYLKVKEEVVIDMSQRMRYGSSLRFDKYIHYN